MSLFKSPKRNFPESTDGSTPVSEIDLSKRYDIYCHSFEDSSIVYENVRILGIRIFEKRKHQFASALIGGYLELEFVDGTRVMVSHQRIQMMCEHGSQPKYRVLGSRKPDGEQHA